MSARRALLAWELGAGFGHLATLRAIGKLLRKSGHACAVAARHLGTAVDFLEPDLGLMVQAPARLTMGRNPVHTQVSYASMLHNIGFDDPLELAGRVRAWRDLMRALRTELVFADHSPIALIAAKSLGLPCVAVGNGFTLPPQRTPFPSFRPRMRIEPQVLEHNEQQVLAELNAALERLKLPAYGSLGEIFHNVSPALLTYAELDHYEVERPEPFLGHPLVAAGRAPTWPAGKGPKVFAYLRPGPSLVPTLEALAASRTRTIVRVAGAPPSALQQFVRAGLTITDESLDMKAVAESCDAFVNYGAHATVCEFLLAGVPGVLIPSHHEQILLCRRVVTMGAGVAVQGAGGIGKALAQVLDDGQFKQAAGAFAGRYAQQPRDRILPEIVEQALARLEKGR